MKTPERLEARLAAPGLGLVSDPDLIDWIAAGQIALIVDSSHWPGHASLVVAAEAATVDKITFLQRYGSGIICVSLREERLEELSIPMMAPAELGRARPAFTVSVDAVEGTTTGISALDRALTIATLINPSAKPDDLARPGHIYPLLYRGPGPGEDRHHADIGLDLAAEAGLYPSGVAASLLNDDGSLTNVGESLVFAEDHDLSWVEA